MEVEEPPPQPEEVKDESMEIENMPPASDRHSEKDVNLSDISIELPSETHSAKAESEAGSIDIDPQMEEEAKEGSIDMPSDDGQSPAAEPEAPFDAMAYAVALLEQLADDVATRAEE